MTRPFVVTRSHLSDGYVTVAMLPINRVEGPLPTFG